MCAYFSGFRPFEGSVSLAPSELPLSNLQAALNSGSTRDLKVRLRRLRFFRIGGSRLTPLTQSVQTKIDDALAWGRKAAVACLEDLLGGFRGILQCDCYSAYGTHAA